MAHHSLLCAFAALVALLYCPSEAFQLSQHGTSNYDVRLSSSLSHQYTWRSRLSESNDDFWEQQKVLAQEMASSTDKSRKAAELEKFAKRRQALVVDTAYISFFLFCVNWMIFDNPFIALSYAIGATLGVAYSYGLGKYVEGLGMDAGDIDAESAGGAGIGQARFAFLILLFVLVSKLRAYGIMEIPTIAGFFTYQIASLNQGLREISD